MQKRILAVNDISCVGRCSLTVALPVLSAAGIETSVLPTAVLSTHTGGFEGYTFRDLTEDISPIVDHLKSLGRPYDGIFTGYLGSFSQLAQISRLIDLLKNDSCFVAVDPVMADNGEYYSFFGDSFAQGMARLCRKADLITPNVTEAFFLLGRPFLPPPYSGETVRELLTALADLGPRQVVLTGVIPEPGKLENASYDRQTGEFSFCLSDRLDGFFPGTGDLFASALLGALLNGKTLRQAVSVAHQTTYAGILRTMKSGEDPRYGVNFEEGLGDYLAALREEYASF